MIDVGRAMSDAADTADTLRLRPLDDREELARAEVYGLLASLYHAPPSYELYEQLRVAVTEAPAAGAFLESSWSEVVGAARILLYGSWFIAGRLNDRPLVELRRDLASLGLERPPTVLETEDHIASLCEVMRYLIAGDDAGVSHLAAQQRFFNAHLRAWAERLCDAITAHPRAGFYRALAGFSRDFFAVETQGFDLLDAQ